MAALGYHSAVSFVPPPAFGAGRGHRWRKRAAAAIRSFDARSAPCKSIREEGPLSRRSHFTSGRSTLCRTRAHALAAILMTVACTASALAAQGRRRGAPSSDPSAPARSAVAPVLWEPEQIFPLAVAHASELKLTDEQRVQIETIGSKLRASNAPLLSSIDTLRPPRIQLPDPNNPSPPAASPPPTTPEEIAAVVARRHALGEARAQVRENIRLARDQMTQLLTPEQQTRLAALETSARLSAERGDAGESGEKRGGYRSGGRTPPM
jgi:Spy/CpxP family protein refolding chaperone